MNFALRVRPFGDPNKNNNLHLKRSRQWKEIT